jgi:UDP-N-acetylmuramate: L-alanyl-gamma-D-glutamyl-meso-diaminopimelate ligase
VLTVGCWSEVEYFDDARGWTAQPQAGGFDILHGGQLRGRARTRLAGRHNRSNALAAVAAAAHVGVTVEAAIRGLDSFRGVKRRLELFGEAKGVEIYDDFAHHPTAIAVTIAALREREGGGRILAVLEPRSNTMRLGGHAQTLAESLAGADLDFVYARPDLKWDAQGALGSLGDKLRLHAELDALIAEVVSQVRAGDRVLVMSNGDFGGVHGKLLEALRKN